MVLSKAEFYTTPGDMVRLFVQESERVIRDRLINATELEAFDVMLEETVKKGIKVDLSTVFTEPRIYTTFAMGTGNAYRPVSTLEQLSKVKLKIV